MKILASIALVFFFCTPLAHAADRPPVCQQSVVPLKDQTPVADLSGTLPVPDYLDSVVNCIGGLTGGMTGRDQPIRSAWLEQDAKRYSALLSTARFPWIVLPAQTQYFGFDRTERALIGAAVADAFMDQGSMPDTLLVARALGEVRRRYESWTVGSLTAAVGAIRRVEVYAGHDGERRMTLTIQLKKCAADGNCQLLKQHDWRNLAFSDESPPFQKAQQLQAEIRREILGIVTPQASARANAAGARTPLLPSPANVMDAAYVADARVASLLASLAPNYGELARERLSIVALREWLRAPTDAESRFFAAFAAMDLERRPYALKLIEKLEDPAAQTLRNLLNGNLPDAQRSIAAVKAPLPRLMLAFKVQDLADFYGRKSQFDAALAQRVFGEVRDQWQSLITRRVADMDLWVGADHSDVKRRLDALSPVQGLSLNDVVVGSAVIDDDTGGQTGISLASFRHLRQALGGLRIADCCAAARPGAARWEMYWLLEGTAQADVLKDLWRLVSLQALPERALALTESYDSILGGEPQFEFARAAALGEVGERARNEDARRFDQRYESAEQIAGYWSQGQTRISRRALFRGTGTLALADAFTHDYPRRSFWPGIPWRAPLPTDRDGCESLLYSIDDIEPAGRCLLQLPEPGKARLRAELQQRFHGHPGIEGLLMQASTVVGVAEPAGNIERLRAAIKADPEGWNNYHGVGDLLIQLKGAYAEAQRTFLSYPAFKAGGDADLVGLSNKAYQAGSDLFWRGQVDLARPLYQIAADLETGSAASMTSAARLAQLDGDYPIAASIFLARATRYADAYAYRDYLSLLHVMGHGDEARSGFLQIAERSDNPQSWVAALVGQRMSGASFEQMKSWVLSEEIRGAHFRGERFAPFFATLWMTTDRKPTAEFAKLMEQIERDAVRTIDSKYFVARPHRFSEEGLELVKQSAFRTGKSPALPDETHVKSEYILLADALAAVHAAQYPAAVDRFVALADLYPIESGDTKVALAYFALAAAKTGDKLGLEAFIESQPAADQDFDVWLSRAFFAAVRHDPGKAADALTRAFNVRPHTDSRPIMTEYQFAEACEIVGRETADPRFDRMLLEWARQHQRMQPTHAWAYAVEAQLSKNPVDANRALAIALYLDPASPRLAKIDGKRKEAASSWLRTNNPFMTKEKRPAERVTQVRQPADSSGT